MLRVTETVHGQVHKYSGGYYGKIGNQQYGKPVCSAVQTVKGDIAEHINRAGIIAEGEKVVGFLAVDPMRHITVAYGFGTHGITA